MSNLKRFAEYAAAFEETYIDDDWTRLVQYFSPDAVYLPGDVKAAVGRENVLQTLRDSVNSLDRMFDVREFTEAPILTEVEDAVTLSFKVRYAKQGLPDLTIFGTEVATYEGGLIQKMEDFIDEKAAAAMAQWLEKHQRSLG